MIVETSDRLSEGPLFRVIVTGPVASVQVISKGLPASTSAKSPAVLVKETVALAMPARMDMRMNFILAAVVEYLYRIKESVEDKKSCSMLEEYQWALMRFA